ncbi:hypothetical protein ROSI111154_08480 [Rouxiella silvae]
MSFKITNSMGKTYSETANLLNIAASTVKFHMANIVKKWVSIMWNMPLV